MSGQRLGLSVVADGSPPEKPPRRRKSVAQAAASGDRRELLVATRDRLARALSAKDTSPRDLAALSKRLLDITDEIEAIDAAAEQEREDRDRDGGTNGDEAWDDKAL